MPETTENLDSQSIALVEPEESSSSVEVPIKVVTEAAKPVPSGKKVVGIVGAVGSGALGMGKAVGRGAWGVGGAAISLGRAAAKQAHPALEFVADKGGHAIEWALRQRLMKLVTRTRFNSLVDVLGNVDAVKAQTAVDDMRRRHPGAGPREIARRLTAQKAAMAGGVSFATSVIPGASLVLGAIDWIAVGTLQSELLYQIAAAYGLDLKEPSRKGEALAIFGLAFGGARAVRASSQLIKNVPGAGPVIGASASAALVYALGEAACRFYEAKELGEKGLAALGEDSALYLKNAVGQAESVESIVYIVREATGEQLEAELQEKLAGLSGALKPEFRVQLEERLREFVSEAEALRPAQVQAVEVALQTS